MSLSLRKSTLERDLFEVWDEGHLLEEISIPFSIRKIPFVFASRELLQKWLEETEWKLARNFAYRCLAMRNLPTILLRKKLEAKRFSPAVCGRLIEELRSLGYLQDEGWMQNEVLRELQKGHGPRYIENKLRSQGLDSSRVREWITPQMQAEKIRQLILKLERKGKQSAMQTLFRRGFDPDIILENFS